MGWGAAAVGSHQCATIRCHQARAWPYRPVLHVKAIRYYGTVEYYGRSRYDSDIGWLWYYIDQRSRKELKRAA